MPKTKVLFFVPHSDDLEFGAPLVVIEALRLGHDVVEVLMTNCEYGTKRMEFKGKRIARIRERELERTIQIYEKHTKNRLRVIRMGHVDGHLPLSKASINDVVNLMRRERPNIVFAPDPWYSMDFHEDHLNTGRIPLLALKELKPSEFPRHFLFYYSFKTNMAIKSRFKDVQIAIEALSQHKSQIKPITLKIISFFRKLSLLMTYRRNNGLATRFRELAIHDGVPEPHGKMESMRDKIKHVLYFKWMNHPSEDIYSPSHEELGLIIKLNKK